MYLLFSSALTNRYREDILRCLSLPVNGYVQFRYEQRLVHDDIWNHPNQVTGGALICYVDRDAPTLVFPLVPIRYTEIVDPPSRPGSTMTVMLRLKQFVEAVPPDFAGVVDRATGARSPRRPGTAAADHPRLYEPPQVPAVPGGGQKPFGGYYFVHVDGSLGPLQFPTSKTGWTRIKRLLYEGPYSQGPHPQGIQQEPSLKHWEDVVRSLCTRKAFADVTFFWTVLASRSRTFLGFPRRFVASRDTDRFSAWQQYLRAGSDRILFLYHFNPITEAGAEPDRLRLNAGGALEGQGPELLMIDSSYDLVRWNYKASALPFRSRPGWLRIGVPDQWDIELNVRIQGAWLTSILLVLILGTLIAAQTGLQELRKPHPSWALILVLWGLGIVTATVAVFGIRRPI